MMGSSTAAISAIFLLFALPASAVDYVACREMRRTANEFMDLEVRLSRMTRDTVKRDYCSHLREPSPADEKYIQQIVKGQYNTYGDDLRNYSNAVGDCVTKAMESNSIRSELADFYRIKRQKVYLDMKKAGCPY
jgi:hypothetical protein